MKVVPDNSNILTASQDLDRPQIMMKYRWMKLGMLQQDRLQMISCFNLRMMDVFFCLLLLSRKLLSFDNLFFFPIELMFTSYRIKLDRDSKTHFVVSKCAAINLKQVVSLL